MTATLIYLISKRNSKQIIKPFQILIKIIITPRKVIKWYIKGEVLFLK